VTGESNHIAAGSDNVAGGGLDQGSRAKGDWPAPSSSPSLDDSPDRRRDAQPAASLGSSVVSGLVVHGFASVTECADQILTKVSKCEGGAAFAVNAEKIVAVREDAALRRLLDRATFRYPDGAGVVVAMRRRGIRTARVPGVDLWLEILRRSAGRPMRVALLGGRPDVLRRTERRLRTEFPTVSVVVKTDGYEGVRDIDRIVASLRDTAPHLVFVALGSPRQELLIVELMQHYPTGFYMGLGGSFDVYCGDKRRAPVWMQNVGLEWLHRFLVEPSRAGREMKRLKFLMLMLSDRL
jgi:UDP-N-acetyl-D-mannosaminouronate:lipid I N-acetyl-D-mannosaminouronosyltransferase